MRQILSVVRSAIPAELRATAGWRRFSAFYGRCAELWVEFALRCVLPARSARQRLQAAGFPLKPQVLVLRCLGGTQAAGFFAELAAVLGALEHYERWKDHYAGLRVDFGESGLYFDANVGKNWWEYFFAPIDLGGMDGAVPLNVTRFQHDAFAIRVEQAMPRATAAMLLDRYVHVKAHAGAEVEGYLRRNFEGEFVIGIHYRGTDKYTEAPRVPYAEVAAEVRALIGGGGRTRYKLFVATDEKPFLDYMLMQFPGNVIYRDQFRSLDGRPTHTERGDGFRKGMDALMDCLLLSRCNFLLRTESDLSLFATFFNPSLPDKLLRTVRGRAFPANRARRLATRILRLPRAALNLADLAYVHAERRARSFLISAGLPLTKQFLVLPCNTGDDTSGLFAEFLAVVGALAQVEQYPAIHAGLHVDFGDQGLYYDRAMGSNWWEYFFEPIEFGTRAGALVTPITDTHEHDQLTYHAETMPRNRAHEIIARHVRPKPKIKELVENYVRENFGGAFVIGLHYRGTDKHEEAPRVPYDVVVSEINAAIDGAGTDRIKIYVATDEQAFLDFMVERFPERLIFRPMFRSADGRPIDVTNSDSNYKKGEDAIVDCLLLSRADRLIRTASNLSLCSTFFNPGTPEVLLNRPYHIPV